MAVPKSLFLIPLFFVGRLPAPQVQDNHPPSVKILSPLNNAIVPAAGVLNFRLAVSDPEDGDSQYDEINPRQVIVALRYENLKSSAERRMRRPVPADPRGLTLIVRSNCMNCHNFREKSIGPSFEEIARTYRSRRIPADTGVRRVKNGSSGFWPGKEKMPSHPEVGEKELKEAVNWIMESCADDNTYYASGLSGSLRLPGKKGWFVLTASYTDNGPRSGTGKSLKGSAQIQVMTP